MKSRCFSGYPKHLIKIYQSHYLSHTISYVKIFQEEVTTLLRSKSANSDQLVTKNEQVSQLEKDVQKLKEENETYVKKLEGFQKTVTENGETMKDFITGHQALQGNFLQRSVLRISMD